MSLSVTELPLLIKCEVWGACHMVATAVLSSMTCNRVSAEFSDSPPVRCVAGRRSCGIPMDSLLSRGLPGRQATLLPAEQNASCTDKPPFLSVSLALNSYEPAHSHSHTPLCICAYVCELNTYMCSHSEQHHAYAEVMTTKQSDGGDISAQLIRLALSLCSGCDIHYRFRTDNRLVLQRTEGWRHLRPAWLWAAEQFGQQENPQTQIGGWDVFPEDVWVHMCVRAHPHMLMQYMHVSSLSGSITLHFQAHALRLSVLQVFVSVEYSNEVYASNTSRKHTWVLK